MPGRATPISTSDPIRSRALGAHQNGIEAFPFFAAAVLLAEFRLCPQRLIDELAVLFLIVRIAYVFTYLGNRPTLRTILWSVRLCDQCRDLLHAGGQGVVAGLMLMVRSASSRVRTMKAPPSPAAILRDAA